MSHVTLTMVFECDAVTPEDANAIGVELENRIFQSIEAIIPHMQHGAAMRDGRLRFDMAVQGRRVRIENDKKKGR